MEDENVVLNSLLRRKQVLESLLSHQKRRAGDGSSSHSVVAVTKTSNPNTPSYQAKTQKIIKTCIQTPVETSIESVDIIENSDVETPVKGQRIQRTCVSPEGSITTSTICLSRSHSFFKTPETTPIKNISSLLSSSVLALNYNTPTTSTAAEDSHYYLPSVGPLVDSADHSPVCTHTATNNAHYHVPGTGSESAAPSDYLPVYTHTATNDAHYHVPGTGSESAAPPDYLPVYIHTAANDAHHHVPGTGPEGAAPPDHLPVYTHTAANEAHHHVPGTGSESAALTDHLPVYAHTAADDAHHHVPSTGSDSAAPIDSSPAFTHVVVDDAHRHLPSTGAELTSTSSAIADHSSSTDTNKLTKSFKKSYVDFLSDEEQEDFSAGSSDVWTCSDSSTSSYDEQSKKKKKRRKIQDKKDKKKKGQSAEPLKDAEITITKRKTKVNERKINQTLKNEGKAYVTPKGKLIVAKSMKDNPCVPNKCKRGCYEISEDRRKSIFSFYWNLDVKRRRDWLVHCARVDGIRRKRVESNRRKITVDYFINYNEDHKKVCQKFLLCTLDITQRHLNNIISNALEGMSQTDLRKRTAKGKYSESAKENVRKFIESLPACPSHYNRKKSQRMYLSQDLRNLTNLYRIYRDDCKNKNEESVSESMFREIFNKEYDLGFHSLKKDKCILCVKAENTREEMTEEDKEILKKHKEEKDASYKRFKAHQTLKDAKTVCSSFDLQKVLNTPYGENMLLYYARKYAVFNFTVYESITQNVYCYTWGECDGKRGSNEIATCLYFYLKELDHQGIETALLYCDSCTGQNKNRIVLSVLNYFLLKSDNLQVIQINYLLPGHTYMPADSVHATIESEVKKIIVWSPSQWASYFETARKKPKPYRVNVMEHTDFINWDDLATKTFTKETSKNIKFKSIRIATFKKKNINKMEIKYSMNEAAVSEKVTLFEKQKSKGKEREN